MPIRPLTSELQEIAINELNEVPSRIQADLHHIREWISKQPHLKARTDDQWLLSFLRGCKFSLQRTKEKLDLYYTVRKLMPEFYSNRDPFLPEMQELLRQGVILVLPKTVHPSAPRICFYQTNKLDPDKISLVTVVKLILMIADILLVEDDNFVVAGVCIMVNLKNFSYSYASQLTLDFSKKVIMCLQHVYSVRVKEVSGYSVPSFVVIIHNMFKRLIAQKLRNRIFLHTEDSLKEVVVTKKIPLLVLPEEDGGEEVSRDEMAAYWKSKVESYRDWFLEDAEYCTDETKRPGKPKTAEELFGVQGSFIKLEVD